MYKSGNKAKIDKYNGLYMDLAHRLAMMSHARRKQVGVIAVRDYTTISDGYNGMPSGMDNCCEDPETGMTRPEVLHAENNMREKLRRSGNSLEDSDVYCTLSACVNCAEIMIEEGVKRFHYAEAYRDNSGILLLEEKGVECIQVFATMPFDLIDNTLEIEQTARNLKVSMS